MTSRRTADDDATLREDGDSDNVIEGKEESEEPLIERSEDAEDAEKKQSIPQTQEVANDVGASQLVFCFVGLQASYLTWGYVQEKVMTREYETGRFPSATFCVFSNRVLAVLVAMAMTVVHHKGELALPAPLYAFAPCALSNSLSSFGQYQALRYVSFPLQTISKSTKVIPVMLVGKLLNRKKYPYVDYVEALVISAGVSLFSLANAADTLQTAADDEASVFLGISMLALYVNHPKVDQFQMMFAVNTWAILMTLFALVTSGELWTTLVFLKNNPVAALDNLTIAITSATGQLFIFYTIKTFGPVVFTIMMTTRQVFSIVLSTIIFGHTITITACFGALAVFAAIFHRIKRQAKKATKSTNTAPAIPPPKLPSSDGPARA
ncbi:hypothetical protein CTAYLR_007210 [Chrysophaeum taylorii]|uniref:Uncharacterized protein n=1 Tax=Chrysophaeum taylorii TaxID=2483200 RepID=A0AAD7UBC6_9STRA|nr:hypothetical protein CTAYLR_007210 [Chrysophaeum taylorii]